MSRWSRFIRYPARIAVTIPFITIRNSQGEVVPVEVSDGYAKTIGGLSFLGLLGYGYLFWKAWNQDKIDEIDLDLNEPYWRVHDSKPMAFRFGNMVYLQGSVTGRFLPSEAIATLPEGWRPGVRTQFCSTEKQYQAYGLVEVHTNGDIRITGSPIHHDWISFNGMNFTISEQ